MTSPDLHEVTFVWPHPEPKKVIVTGTFDEWSESLPLTRTETGFQVTTKVPWDQKIKYKFVVDGEWLNHEDQPMETDPGGFLNNIYISPPKPSDSVDEPSVIGGEAAKAPVKDADPTTNGDTTANGHSVLPSVETEVQKPVNGVEPSSSPAQAAEAAVAAQSDSGKATTTPRNGEPKLPDTSSSGYPQLLSDIASTIVARDGTSSALGYVASGIGAAMHNMVGIDPINIPKIAIPTPKPGEEFNVPGGQESVPNTADLPPESAPSIATVDASTPESLHSPIAPRVPIMIVPVNAPENNTIGTPPPTEPEFNIPRVGSASPPAEAVSKPATEESEVAVAESTNQDIPVVEVTEATPVIQQEEAGAAAPVVEDVVQETAPVVAESPETPSAASPAPVVEEPAVEAKVEEVTVAVAEPVSREPIQAAAAEKTEEPVIVEVAPETIAEVKGTSDVVPDVEEVVGEAKTEEPAAVPEAPVALGDAQDKTEAKVEEIAAAEPAIAVVEVKAEEPAVSEVAASTIVPDSVEEPKATVVEGDAVVAKADEPAVSEPEPAETSEVKPIVSEAVTEKVDERVEEPKADEQTSVPEVAAAEVPAAEVKEEPVEVKEEEPVDVPAPAPVETALTAEASITQAEEKVEEILKEAPAEQKPAVAQEIKDDDSSIAVPVEEVAAIEPEDIVGITTVRLVQPSAGSAEPVIEVDSAPPAVETTPVAPEAPAPAAETEVPPAATEPPAAAKPAEVTEVARTPEPKPEVEQPKATPAEAPKVEEKPATNGSVKEPSTPAVAPKSEEKEKFPAGSTTPPEHDSPASSKFNSTRKKRTSIFGKLKNIFHSDKDKDKEGK